MKAANGDSASSDTNVISRFSRMMKGSMIQLPAGGFTDWAIVLSCVVHGAENIVCGIRLTGSRELTRDSVTGGCGPNAAVNRCCRDNVVATQSS